MMFPGSRQPVDARAASAALDAGSHGASGRGLFQSDSSGARDEQVATLAALAALKHDQPLMAAQLAQQALVSLPHSAGLNRIAGAALYRLGDWNAARDAHWKKVLPWTTPTPCPTFYWVPCFKSSARATRPTNFQRAQQLDARYTIQP